MKFWLASICFLCFNTFVSAQTFTNVEPLVNPKETIIKSPKTAAIFSAVLPGAGQVYNRKYWKVPIVYAALGTAIYYIDYNTKQYRIYRTEYVARLDGNEETKPSDEFALDSDVYIDESKKFYKRLLDISYASLAVVYVLNIIDASVDAHLFTFDVSEDLSLNWQPTNTTGLDNRQYTGVKFSLTF